MRDRMLQDAGEILGRILARLPAAGVRSVDERVLLGAKLLEKGDLAGFGALMFDSHESSRSWFENSCAELDTIVDAARAIPEVLGARLSGGGFGGSCCLLVKPDAADRIAASITQAYRTIYGDEPECRLVKPSDGAHLV